MIIDGFRRILHGGDYNPDQWQQADGVIEQDFDLMTKAECNAFSVGIFSWSQLEPEEDQFEFGWLDDVFERAARQGIKLFLATPSAGKPAWLAQKYPDAQRVGADGRPEPWQCRQNNCLSSPDFRRRVQIINRKLAERYAAHPALGGWHISNEYFGECRCERCQNEFRDFLRRRYRTLDRLNQVYWTAFWGHRIGDWSQISPFDASMESTRLDWLRYVTQSTVDFFRMEIAAVREFSDAPVTTNMMGIYPGLDYWKFAPFCDFITDDCYPQWYTGQTERVAATYSMYHDMHYSMKNQPFVMLESCPGVPGYHKYPKFRRPLEFEREMLLAIGHGADGTMYFQWRKGRGNCEKTHGAVVGHDGSDRTMIFRQVADYGARLATLSDVAGARKNPPRVALVFDWESNWALNLSCGFGGEKTTRAAATIADHYQALWRHNIDLAVLDSTGDFSPYKVVVAPMLFMLREGVSERLIQFVEAGGTLVMTYLSAYVDEVNQCFSGGNPGGPSLRRLFGIWNEDIDGMEPEFTQSIEWNGKSYPVAELAELLHAEGATVLGTYGGEFYAGTPALTARDCGAGRAIYIGARTGGDFLNDFYGQLLARCGIEPVLPDLPPTLTASRRGNYYFLQNLTAEPQSCTLPQPMTERWRQLGSVSQIELPPRGSAVLTKD